MDDRGAMLVQDNFKAIGAQSDGAEKLTTMFYANLFRDYPDVREFFPVSMDAQRLRLYKSLGYIVGRLRAPGQLSPFLRELGRDHRKYGVNEAHYVAVGAALLEALRDSSPPGSWNEPTAAAWRTALHLVVTTMSTAAEAETTPPVWTATVTQHQRILRDLAIIRLRLAEPMRLRPGQYVSVQIPGRPRMWRQLSPAAPLTEQGDIEFHVRAVAGGWVSQAIVEHTQAGEQWLLARPKGELGIPVGDERSLLLAGCGTGLAPVRAQILELAARQADRVTPPTHLFVTGHHPCDLYGLAELSALAREHSWLTVTAIVEQNENPWWHAENDLVPLPSGVPVLTGQIGKVIADAGPWTGYDIQLAGPPAMLSATRFRLIAAGAMASQIRQDPIPAG